MACRAWLLGLKCGGLLLSARDCLLQPATVDILRRGGDSQPSSRCAGRCAAALRQFLQSSLWLSTPMLMLCILRVLVGGEGCSSALRGAQRTAGASGENEHVPLEQAPWELRRQPPRPAWPARWPPLAHPMRQLQTWEPY